MNDTFKSLLKKFSFQDEALFLESFDSTLLSQICRNRSDHIFQRLYGSSVEFIRFFFETSDVGRLLRLRAYDNSDLLEINIEWPDHKEVLKLVDRYPAKYGLGFELFQKVYLDRGYNFPRNVNFTYTRRQSFLKFNRFSSIGYLSDNVSRINLIAGASETFQLVGLPQGYGDDDGNSLLRLGFPFHEANETISIAKEGASFDIIVDSINKLSTRLESENIGIDIIAGTFGWHNLIYNDTTEEFWSKSFEQILLQCKRLCIFEIYSPILHLSNDDIASFSATPTKCFWNDLPVTNQSIDLLRSAMIRFNLFIKDFAGKKTNVLIVPVNDLCPIPDLEFATKHFLDINHVTNDTTIRAMIFNSIDSHFRSNSKFFIPDVKMLSEYTYPLF